MCVRERKDTYNVVSLYCSHLFRDLQKERKQLEEVKKEWEAGLKQQSKENRLSVEGKINTSVMSV